MYVYLCVRACVGVGGWVVGDKYLFHCIESV
jgi:hypothetical protein